MCVCVSDRGRKCVCVCLNELERVCVCGSFVRVCACVKDHKEEDVRERERERGN